MFPDNTQLQTSNKDVDKIFEILNDHLANFSDWMTANKPSVDKSKTEIFLKN